MCPPRPCPTQTTPMPARGPLRAQRPTRPRATGALTSACATTRRRGRARPALCRSGRCSNAGGPWCPGGSRTDQRLSAGWRTPRAEAGFYNFRSATAALKGTASMEFSASIFKAYDIRGVVPSTLDEEVAHALGLAFGTVALAEGEKCVAVGRDGRLSGPSLSRALVQ